MLSLKVICIFGFPVILTYQVGHQHRFVEHVQRFLSNETADQFAKQAASQDFVAPETALGIPTTKIRSAAQLWANAQQRKLWQTTSGCRQAKIFLHGPDKKLSRYAAMLSSLPRRELKILVGLYTYRPYNN